MTKVVNDTPAVGNLVKVQKPAYLTLTGSPANSVSFKIVRKDPTGAKPMPATKVVPRRTRRSDAKNPVLCLTFPKDTTEAEVTAALTVYGMADYSVSVMDDGLYQAKRSDLQSIAKEGTVSIPLTENGLMATVLRSDSTADAPGEKNGVALVALEFDTSKFTTEQVGEWLTRNSIDSKTIEPENPDNAYVVRRSDVPETEETRRMEVEEGITAVLTRADVYDIPDGMFAVINECAYGNWGWGHLDFTATMADVVFSEQLRESVTRLDDVLRNILWYNQLPLDVRKALVNNALTQFGEYVGTIMDSLPRQLLVSVVRSAKPNLENSMTKANDSGATPVAGAAPAATETISRADAQKMIDEAVTKALATVQRTDAAPAAPAATVAAPAAAAAAPAADAVSLTRSDLAAAFADAVKPLAERLDKMEGQTIARSDAGDTAVTSVVSAAAAATGAKGGKEEVFRGAFPGLRGRKAE